MHNLPIIRDAFPNLYGESKGYTRREGPSQSRLDCLYIKDFQFSIPQPLSDHDIVILTIQNIQTTQRGKGVWINNTQVYKSENFQRELSARWGKWRTLDPILVENKIFAEENQHKHRSSRRPPTNFTRQNTNRNTRTSEKPRWICNPKYRSLQ